MTTKTQVWQPMRAYAFLVAAALTFALGCGTAGVDRATERKVDEAVNREPAASNEQLRQKAEILFEGIPNLSSEQRQRLRELRQAKRYEMDTLREQSEKLRSLLIEALVKPDYRAEEVNVLKKRIEDVEHKRTSSLFDAVDKTNAILGRHHPARQKVMHEFMDRVDRVSLNTAAPNPVY